MKQYSIYFTESKLSKDRKEISIATDNEITTLKLTQPGVLILDEPTLIKEIGTLAPFGIEKIVSSGDMQMGLVIEKTPIEVKPKPEPLLKPEKPKE